MTAMQKGQRMSERVVIATRGSKLALWQAEHVKALLCAAHPGLTIELRVISTRGDRTTDVAIARIGEKGVFTAELEAALRDETCDAAVHSYKDMPTEGTAGLAVTSVLKREDPRDVLVVRRTNADFSMSRDNPFAALPHGARLGTSSLRRRAQALALRPDLKTMELRGNVDTRLAKLERGECDAILLAAAGMVRLGVLEREGLRIANKRAADTFAVSPLGPPMWLTAAAQGAIAIETRTNDARMARLLAPLHHQETAVACDAERAFLHAVEGGCQAPVGAWACVIGERMEIQGGVFALDGGKRYVGKIEANTDNGTAQATALARRLLDDGAGSVIAAIRKLA